MSSYTINNIARRFVFFFSFKIRQFENSFMCHVTSPLRSMFIFKLNEIRDHIFLNVDLRYIFDKQCLARNIDILLLISNGN